jgi:hypothetical protein
MPSPSHDNFPERGVGILALLGSVLFTYLGVYKPISDAGHYQPAVPLSTMAAILAPLLLALGVVYTLFGPLTAGILRPRNRPSLLGWAFYIFFITVGLLVYWWVKSVVTSQMWDEPA